MQVSCVTSWKGFGAEELPGPLKQGDIVKIYIKDKSFLDLKLVTVTPEALVGTPIPDSIPEGSEVKEQRVEFADVVWLDKAETRAPTIGEIAATVILLPIALIYLLFSLAPFHS
jgi:hypothetical protein